MIRPKRKVNRDGEDVMEIRAARLVLVGWSADGL